MSNPRWRVTKRTPANRPVLSNPTDHRRYNQNIEPKRDGANNTTVGSSCLSKQKVLEFLQGNHQVIEEYVDNAVSLETIQKWLTLKMEKQGKYSSNRTRPGICDCQLLSTSAKCSQTMSTRKLLQELLPLASSFNKMQLLQKASSYISIDLKADSYRLHHVITTSNGDKSLASISDSGVDNNGETVDVKEGDTIAGYVASTAQIVFIENCNKSDSRFPNMTGALSGIAKGSTLRSVLAAPFTQQEVIGVIELTRRSTPFTDENVTLLQQYVKWTSVLMDLNCSDHKTMDSALLEIFRKIFFSDTIGLEQILQVISDQAVKLLLADRSSIFLVDKPRGELYAQVFGMPVKEMEYIEKIKELTLEVNQSESTKYAYKHATEGLHYKGDPIRFPVSHGIAGHVARTGEIVLCEDAASDERFNIQVDLKTGYETKTILCGPLKSKSGVSGVIELINKTDGQSFTVADQQLFSQYIEHCSRIYETAKAFLDAKYSEQQYKVAIEMLAYHRQSTEGEVYHIKEAAPLSKDREVELLSPQMNTLTLNELEHIQATFYMFSELAQMANISHLFNSDVVLRFILTVSKNYRHIPYHGWYHGFWVAQCMYATICSNPQVFNGLEMLALFVASLCHDLDHRGFTNNFFEINNSPLAALYSTSIMENHHFDQTLAILQTPGVDLFSSFDANSFKQILYCMEHAILSTDISSLEKRKGEFKELIDKGTFDWTNDSHKLIGHAMLMVGCDISAIARPWDMHRLTVDWLMHEFYKQGDKEREIGLVPLQLMDKQYQHKLPLFQIGFIQGVSIPCYKLLSSLFPTSMEALIQGAEDNIRIWQQQQQLPK